MGVSATHLDWTMVPYLRRSFFKHFKEGLKYIGNHSDESVEQILKTFNLSKESSIEDENYKRYRGIYEYTFDMTKKELDQAVEGFYHNLNY